MTNRRNRAHRANKQHQTTATARPLPDQPASGAESDGLVQRSLDMARESAAPGAEQAALAELEKDLATAEAQDEAGPAEIPAVDLPPAQEPDQDEDQDQDEAGPVNPGPDMPLRAKVERTDELAGRAERMNAIPLAYATALHRVCVALDAAMDVDSKDPQPRTRLTDQDWLQAMCAVVSMAIGTATKDVQLKAARAMMHTILPILEENGDLVTAVGHGSSPQEAARSLADAIRRKAGSDQDGGPFKL